MTDMKEVEVVPCPKCGAAPLVVSSKTTIEDGRHGHRSECPQCGYTEFWASDGVLVKKDGRWVKVR